MLKSIYGRSKLTNVAMVCECHACIRVHCTDTFYLFGDIDRQQWAPLLEHYPLPVKYLLPAHETALSFGAAGKCVRNAH
jgi:hypothetical protein